MRTKLLSVFSMEIGAFHRPSEKRCNQNYLCWRTHYFGKDLSNINNSNNEFRSISTHLVAPSPMLCGNIVAL